MNFDDDDAPPDLIGADEKVEVPEEKAKKVPITIVTGLYCYGFTLLLGYIACSYTNPRIPWSWENHTAQLHPDCKAWQKGCCDYEW